MATNVKTATCYEKNNLQLSFDTPHVFGVRQLQHIWDVVPQNLKEQMTTKKMIKHFT